METPRKAYRGTSARGDRSGGADPSPILLVTVDYPPMEGGISSLTAGLARGLASRGAPVMVLGPRLAHTPFFTVESGIPVYRSPLYGASHFRLFPILALFPWLVHRYRVRRVIALNIGYGGVASWLYRGRPGPFEYLVYAYGFEFMRFARSSAVRALYARIYRRARRVVAISRFVAAELEAFGAPRDSIRIVTPGIDPARWDDPGPAVRLRVRERFGLQGKPIVLSVSRFIERKGHERMLRAFQAASRLHPDARLVLVGRGRILPDVRAEARRMEIADRVVFTDYVGHDELAALYHEAALFVLMPWMPEDRRDAEGFGIVFLEAGCCGVPSLATRSGGVEDAVVHGETGLILEPDDVDGMGRAMVDLLGNPGLSLKLGRAARERVLAEFTWERAAARVLDLWEGPA